MAGINPSDIVYKKALEATISAVKRGVESDRAINSGINVIRGTSWFQTKNHQEQRTIETSFRESMQKEFGLAVSPDIPPAPSIDKTDFTKTEVIDRASIPTEPLQSNASGSKKVETKPVVKPTAKPVPPKPRPKPVQTTSHAAAAPAVKPVSTPKPQPVVAAKAPKKRGMGLLSFIGSLFFLGFLAWISWILYHHEINIENIVVYQDDELIFKDEFPSQAVSIFGQEVQMNNVISRKTNPIKVYRPTSGFPFWELNQELPCDSCDYWTNVQNYDLHHYPNKK